jgi:FRG domain
MDSLSKTDRLRFAASPVKCPQSREKIVSLADYLAVVSNAIRTPEPFWFRGHETASFSLTPSALRYASFDSRTRALALMSDFKRIAGSKLRRPPERDAELEWVLIAQHHGLPTRLLDWTESATTALYFACLNELHDGMVFILNPVDLNRLSYASKPHVLDPQADADVIMGYLKMGARPSKGGRYPLAINPISERLIMQKGVFTLHGRRFGIDGPGVPSLAAIPILRESKPVLRAELQRIGVDELTLFPELEHACAHLKRKAGLEHS